MQIQLSRILPALYTLHEAVSFDQQFPNPRFNNQDEPSTADHPAITSDKEAMKTPPLAVWSPTSTVDSENILAGLDVPAS